MRLAELAPVQAMGGLSPATLVRRKRQVPPQVRSKRQVPPQARSKRQVPPQPRRWPHKQGFLVRQLKKRPTLQIVNSDDEDERMVYEPTDPSEPRCPSGDSSSDSEDEAESPLKRDGGGAESESK